MPGNATVAVPLRLEDVWRFASPRIVFSIPAPMWRWWQGGGGGVLPSLVGVVWGGGGAPPASKLDAPLITHHSKLYYSSRRYMSLDSGA
jgi:hypothetical protein